jgi:hypothetical protein
MRVAMATLASRTAEKLRRYGQNASAIQGLMRTNQSGIEGKLIQLEQHLQACTLRG